MNKYIKVTKPFLTGEVFKPMAKQLRKRKSLAVLLVLIGLVGTLALNFAFSALINYVIIGNTGRIGSGIMVTAESGSQADIQKAVNEVAAQGGGTVCIPAGVWDSYIGLGQVNPDGGPTARGYVEVPGGVNVFGDADPPSGVGNGTIRTSLLMADAASSFSKFFELNGENGKPIRISGINLVGWREVADVEATRQNMYRGIDVYDVIDFRIDNCYFDDLGDSAIGVGGSLGTQCRGLIDHICWVNDWGDRSSIWYSDNTVGYGIGVGALQNAIGEWEEDPSKVLGKYEDDSSATPTVYIEDSYTHWWRHTVCSSWGSHWVFRHNVIQYDAGGGSLDSHGGRDSGTGTRCTEIYENQFLDSRYNAPKGSGVSMWPDNEGRAIQLRGGCAVVFNNYVRNYRVWAGFGGEGGTSPYREPHDCWVWGDTLEHDYNPAYPMVAENTVAGNTPALDYWINGYDPTRPSDPYYWTEAPDIGNGSYRLPIDQDGVPGAEAYITYTPYQYPHPLQTGEHHLHADAHGPYGALLDNPTINFFGSASVALTDTRPRARARNTWS